jgi:uncharacterized membrane protein YcaP (DUF421 family)
VAIIFRIAAVYVFILIALRLIGKRELGELSPFELIMLILIPEIVSQSLAAEDSSIINGLTGLSTLLLLVLLTSFLSYRFKRFRNLIQGEPVMLGENGRLDSESMAKERIAVDEVLSEMRRVGLSDLGQVKWIVLETDGKLTFVPFKKEDRTQRAPHERLTG